MSEMIMKKVVTNVAKNELKNVEKNVKKMAKPPPGEADGKSGSDKGCCKKCGANICKRSPWTQVLCWVMIALIISTILLWLGGAFLVGPAKGNTSHDQCGVSINIPVLNKDAYVFYLGTTGIIVTIMIFSSCICCCSLVPLCSTGCPKVVKICGIIGLILALLATSVYIGWVALGTYFVIKIHGGDTICRNTIIYLILLYVYLFILVLAGFLGVIWKCNNSLRGSSSRSRSGSGGGLRRTK